MLVLTRGLIRDTQAKDFYIRKPQKCKFSPEKHHAKKCNNSRTVGLTGPGFLMCGVKYQIQIYYFLKEHVRLILLTSGSLKQCGFLERNIDSRKIKQLPNHWSNGARLSDVRS